MPNPFVHVELLTHDLPKATEFYTQLFDWQLKEIPEIDYTLIEVGQGTGGGMMKCPMPGLPPHWLAYVLVEDVAASLAKAKSLGATVIKEVMEVPNAGKLAIFADPTGAALALWQPNENMKP